jgi:hypothetical protein
VALQEEKSQRVKYLGFFTNVSRQSAKMTLFRFSFALPGQLALAEISGADYTKVDEAIGEKP